MPICTTCTHPVPHLYTLYPSKYNLRLEQCPNCQAFADPYVENDPLILLLDLILLKRGVYRHLLFNHNAPPRKLDREGKEVAPPQEDQLGESTLLCRLFLGLTAVDAFIRYTSLQRSRGLNLWPEERRPYTEEDWRWTRQAAEGVGRMLGGCLVETAVFHAAVVMASWVVLSLLRAVRPPQKSDADESTSPTWTRISLSLLYSSLTKLFLLLLLCIWDTQPPSSPTLSSLTPSSSSLPPNPLASLVPAGLLPWFTTDFLSDKTLDRPYLIRHLLGGFSAGFGLRVVLDCHPLLTTGVVLVAWAVEGWVRGRLEGWVEG